MTAPAIYADVTAYTLSVLPRDFERYNANPRRHWSLRVKRSDQWDGTERWFVTDGFLLLTRGGKWRHRSQIINPAHIYYPTAEEALARAREWVTNPPRNGGQRTVQELQADYDAQKATGKGWDEA